jgi:hypothetical protein
MSQELKNDIHRMATDVNSPNPQTQRDIIKRVIFFIYDQRKRIRSVNESIHQLIKSLSEVELESDLNPILKGEIMGTNIYDILEFTLGEDVDGLLWEISIANWKYQQRPWYKSFFRQQRWNAIDMFKKNEYIELKSMWTEETFKHINNDV